MFFNVSNNFVKKMLSKTLNLIGLYGTYGHTNGLKNWAAKKMIN